MTKDVVEIRGVKDGIETVLGTATMPPEMKRRCITIEMFSGSLSDDMSDASFCLYALERYHDWLVDNGWSGPTMEVIPPVQATPS